MSVQPVVDNLQRSSKIRAFSLLHGRFDKMLSFFGRALQWNVEGTCSRYQGRTNLTTGRNEKMSSVPIKPRLEYYGSAWTLHEESVKTPETAANSTIYEVSLRCS